LAGRTDFLADDSAIGILRRADHYLVADLIVSAPATRGGSRAMTTTTTTAMFP
jgi:hypothetical protein